MSNTRKVTRPVGARITTPGPTSAKLLLVGALGSAAAMATLVAGGPAATAAAASHDSETVPASLTADTQPSGQPAAQALPPSSSGTNSSTFSMSDFLSAAATHIQGAASAVNQAFWDGMELQGQAEITNAQANLAMGQGLVNAFPYAVDQATSWGEAGLVRGTIIGGVAGGVIGGAAGTVTVPGVGTGVGVAGGAYVGGEGGLIFGTIIGGTAGFFNGLVTAPSWNGSQGPQVQDSTTQNPAVAAQGSGDTGATSPGTALPQGLAGELGLGPSGNGQVLGQGTGPTSLADVLGLGSNGLVLAQGTGPTSDVWQTAGNSNQQSADQQGGAGAVTVVASGDDSGSSATGGTATGGTVAGNTVTGGTTTDDTGTYQTADSDPTPVTDPTDLDS